MGYRDLLRVGLPLVLGMGSSTIMQFTDRLFLARHSVEAIAAATPASLAALTTQLSIMGVTSYVAVIIAQYYGSEAPHRIGSALWQGIWSAVLGGLLLALLYFAAPFIFSLSGHEASVQAAETTYFRVLNGGVVFALLANCLGGFFTGRGQTGQVMVANILGALLNIPLDYAFIFGLPLLGIPSLGILGAGIATVAGSAFTACFLAILIFTRENEEKFSVRSGWRFQPEMFRRLLRFGLPNSVNYFIELLIISWFVFEVGALGTAQLAASNIAFALNSLIFTPMMGMSMAVAALTGQSMGAGKAVNAERAARNGLHLTFVYIIPICFLFMAAPGFLMDLFIPGGMDAAAFAPVRATGIILLYYIALYSLVDACNLVFMGALKGVGDTRGIMYILLACASTCMIIPILVIKYFFTPSINAYWIALTVYVMASAGANYQRFRSKRWLNIRVVETARPVEKP